MQLDSSRNHIILVNLWLSMISISVMAATILPAFFGAQLFFCFQGIGGGALLLLRCCCCCCWQVGARLSQCVRRKTEKNTQKHTKNQPPTTTKQA